MSFLLFGLTSHNSHSLSSYVRFLKVSDIFMVFPELTPFCPCLLYWKPRMDTELQMSHQCWAGGRAHLPQPAGYTLCHSAWKAVDFFAVSVGYWLIFSLVFMRTPWSLSAQLLSSCWLASPCCGAQGCLSPGVGVDIFLSCTS